MENINATKALELLRPIPADRFIKGDYEDSRDPTKGCVIGLINRALTGDNWTDTDAFGIRPASVKYIRAHHPEDAGCDIAGVNNDPVVNGYKQRNRKERVIKFLEDMVQAGY